MDGRTYTEFVVETTGNSLTSRKLVCQARDLATEHAIAFLDLVATLP